MVRITVGIDATNLRRGGGVTHLVELLREAQPEKLGIDRVVVWGGSQTLDLLEDRPWLCKCNPEAQESGVLRRTLWQRHRLSQAARDEGCDLLFVPGGSYAGDFHPVVTMSQNLLPFEMRELLRYGFSLFSLKMLMLRLTQSLSFRKSEGVVFLTEGAREAVIGVTGKLKGETCIIPHGSNSRFKRSPAVQRAITDYDDAHPFRILYVSIIDQYKHQWHVAEAVSSLRKQGMPVVLDLVGPAYPPALERLNAVLDQVDLDRRVIHYLGAIPYTEMDAIYSAADMAIWASTCETFGIILLEAMAAGLPVACSKNQPMPEVVGDAAMFFDPERPADIARVLQEMLASPTVRTRLVKAGHERARQFTWKRCSEETFGFLAKVARRHRDQ